MFKNFGLIFVNETECFVESTYFQVLPIIAFLIGFIVFKFVFQDASYDSRREDKIKRSQEYLKKYQKENEDFFFQATEEQDSHS
jgi:hypothetical protein